MKNPWFTKFGIPVRMPVQLLDSLLECSLILERAEETLTDMVGSGERDRISHIVAKWDGEVGVSFEVISIDARGTDGHSLSIGFYKFSDRGSRPLFLMKAAA